MHPSLRQINERALNLRDSLHRCRPNRAMKGTHVSCSFALILLVVPILGLGMPDFRALPSETGFSAALSQGVVAVLPGMGTTHPSTQQVYSGYYDSHPVTYLCTDTSSRNGAAIMHINYSAALAADQASPAIYLVRGRAAPRQVAVFGSEPGEQDYSPLRLETIVTWSAGVKPILLTSSHQILALARQGQLTAVTNAIVLNCPIISTNVR